MSERAEAELLVPDNTAEFIAQGRRDAGVRAALDARACCCPSRPAVRVFVPSKAEPGSWIDLLLCGHHYRRSRESLDLVRASIGYVGDGLS